MESAPKTTWAAGSDGRADVGGKCSSGAGRAHATRSRLSRRGGDVKAGEKKRVLSGCTRKL